MKIHLVHNRYQHPGGEDVVFELEGDMLRAAGHTVTTYCRSNDGIRLDSCFSKIALVTNAIWSAESHREMASRLRQDRPDIVHVHNTFPRISPSIYSTCAEAGIPVVQTLHNYRMFCSAGTLFRDGHVCESCLKGGRWRGVLRGCYRDSRMASAAIAFTHAIHGQMNTWDRGITRYIALTRFSLDKFIQAGLPAAKLQVKPNFLCPDPGPREGDGRYALFVGRLSPEKSARTLIEAWSLLGNRIPLLVIGGGPELETLRSEAARRGLDSIQFLGHQPRQLTIAMMREARFMILTSKWYENFPMVIVEGFACGLPIVCPRLGAMEEIVADREAGLHYEAGDATDLAAKASWAWANPSDSRSMGRQARRVYETNYTAERNYPILMNIYKDALREFGVPNPR